MPSILVVCPSPTDATSFYRGVGPFARLQRDYPQVRVTIAPPRVEWPDLHAHDAIFVLRGYTPGHVELVDLARDLGLKVWVDYDDDLFHVPTDNPAHDMYSDEHTQRRAAKIIASADVVTVTTGDLKRKFSKLNKNVRVIPNALDEKILRYRSWKPGEHKPVILWRGSITHQRDIATYCNEIFNGANNHKDWRFHFQGMNPWYLTDMLGDRAVVGPPLPICTYFNLIRTIQPGVAIVPLNDNTFNRSKSNIAWLEATYAGAACLVPGWEEWTMPGVVSYTDEASFGQGFDDLLSGKVDLAKSVADSWEHIEKNYLLSQTNLARLSVLEELDGV